MEELTLKRTGRRPLAFAGEILAEASTRLRDSTRWTTAKIFRTKGGKTVAGIAHMTCWQGEHDTYVAEAFDDDDGAITYVEANAPALADAIAKQLGIAERVE